MRKIVHQIERKKGKKEEERKERRRKVDLVAVGGVEGIDRIRDG